MSTISRLNLIHAATGIAAFALLGPPFGGIVVAAINAIMSLAQGLPLHSVALATAGLLMFSWGFGAIPATVTGLAYALASMRLQGLWLKFATSTCGGALSFAWFMYKSSDIHFSLLLAPSGLIAGLVMATLLSRVWPNKSFKPNPLRGSA